jgi:glycine hydroxymethyltransferase
MTTRGFGPDEFVRVVELIDAVLSDPDDEAVHERARRDVHALCERFPLYDFVVA